MIWKVKLWDAYCSHEYQATGSIEDIMAPLHKKKLPGIRWAVLQVA